MFDTMVVWRYSTRWWCGGVPNDGGVEVFNTIAQVQTRIHYIFKTIVGGMNLQKHEFVKYVTYLNKKCIRVIWFIFRIHNIQ